MDVFLSHSSIGKDVVRDVASRLKADGVRVWFDEWEIKPGDSIPAKIEAGLEHSRVLVLCMSAAAFGSDWAQLESHTFRFKDPLNRDRHFIPLRLDDSPIKGSLAQFLYINWRPKDRKQGYAKLLEACRSPAVVEDKATHEQVIETATQVGEVGGVWDYAFSPDGHRVIMSLQDKSLRLVDVETGCC